MIPDVLEYLLRLTVIWMVLLAYYFIALRRSGFAVQRFYLLGSLAFGLVVPLLPALGGGLPMVNLPSVTYVAEPYFYTGEAAAEATGFTWSWSAVLPWLYLTGVVFFAARTLVQWKGLWQWRTSGRTDRYDGYRVIRHRGITGPFVAFGCIFMPAEMPDADLEHTALIHEAAHLRARHHYDTLLLTIGSLLLWFHPLFWMLRSLLATVHEYEADAAVIQRVPVRTYGLQLLKSTLMASSTHAPDLQLDSLHGGFVSKILIWLRPNSGFAVSPPQQTTGAEGQVDESIPPSGPAGYPGLFSSPIKKRITMITDKTRARKLRLLPLFTLCLLLAGLVVACSDMGESVAAPAQETAIEIIEGPVENSLADTDRSGGFYADTEDLDASMNAYLKDIYQEIRYPAAARSTGTSGKFRAKLRLGTDGKMETINIGKFTDDHAGGPPAFPEIVIVGYLPEKTSGPETPGLIVDEIDRVLNETDRFKPMFKGGVPARQSMNLDFTFKLEK